MVASVNKVVVDSCGWIAWLQDDSRAAEFAQWLHDSQNVVVPTLVLFEVLRWVHRNLGGEWLPRVSAVMQQCEVAVLSPEVASLAVELSVAHHLATADALVYAHARWRGLPMATSDGAFAGLPGVLFVVAAT